MKNQKQNLTTVVQLADNACCSPVAATLGRQGLKGDLLEALRQNIKRELLTDLSALIETPAFVKQIGDYVLRQVQGTLTGEPQQQNYSVKQLAAATASHGVKKYTAWSIRQACNEGRIQADKNANGWFIPFSEVQRMLDGGI